MGVPTKLWCKHSFRFYPQCDVLMNNLSESFNSTILEARDRPIMTMCEWIRNCIINRVTNNLVKLNKWKHNVIGSRFHALSNVLTEVDDDKELELFPSGSAKVTVGNVANAIVVDSLVVT